MMDGKAGYMMTISQEQQEKIKNYHGIQIELEGTEEYTVQYRVHLQDLGWQSWIQDGETSWKYIIKTTIEAIEIKIIKNENKNKDLRVRYVAHVQDEGWQDYKFDGKTAGTTGRKQKR